MPAHSSMPVSEVSSIVRYILSLSQKAPASKNLPVVGSYTTNVKPDQTNKGTFIFRAAYKDRGSKFAPAQSGENIVVLRHPNIPVNNTDGSREMDFNTERTVAVSKSAGASLQLKSIDLSDLKGIEFILNGDAKGNIEIHLDSPTGPVIGSTTGGSNIANLQATKGKRNLWFVFSEKGSQVSALRMLSL